MQLLACADKCGAREARTSSSYSSSTVHLMDKDVIRKLLRPVCLNQDGSYEYGVVDEGLVDR
jgi:hypothetical protein